MLQEYSETGDNTLPLHTATNATSKQCKAVQARGTIQIDHAQCTSENSKHINNTVYTGTQTHFATADRVGTVPRRENSWPRENNNPQSSGHQTTHLFL